MSTIYTDRAPKPVGPYSQARRAGTHLYLSGQIALDPETGILREEDVAVQASQAFNNLEEVCRTAGASFSDVVRVGIYLTDLADFAVVNDVMAQLFPPPYPTRSTIQVVALPLGALVEVDAIAVVPEK